MSRWGHGKTYATPRRSFCGIYSRFGVIMFLCSSCLPSFHSGDPPLHASRNQVTTGWCRRLLVTRTRHDHRERPSGPRGRLAHAAPLRARPRGAPEEREKWSNEHQRMFGYRPKSASGAGRWQRGRRRRRWGQLQEARVGLVWKGALSWMSGRPCWSRAWRGAPRPLLHRANPCEASQRATPPTTAALIALTELSEWWYSATPSGWQHSSVRFSRAFHLGHTGGRCIQPATAGPSRAACLSSRWSRLSMRVATE